ncbi:MAG TPA: LuxR C-terminal-related transcriptional regulator [Anaerolineae bacterium]|nr:LuxR C-terminal-related transcriptional regulator [Anaerolineae bacterium]
MAWLSLDEKDNDPARFVSYFIAALQAVDPHIGQAALAMMQSPQPPPPELLLTRLVNDIDSAPRPFVLVFDDYHLVSSQAIHQQVAFLLGHHPPTMHLVIGTREDPPLPLSRLWASGQMVDIRQADLRFTREETADFLQRVMQLELSSADVGALLRRTEGWIAGLQLAAHSMQGRDDIPSLVQSLSGSHRYILDYLIEEVFRRQPPDVQDFLLRTSILERLTAPLCDSALGIMTSHQNLERLDAANLFIVPLDQERRWYRYHRLFADLLRQRLRTTGPPDLVSELHRRASQWYEDAGHSADAVHHALAGADWGRASSLILSLSETMLMSGEVVTLLGWFRLLPEERVCAHLALCLQYCWALILTGQIEAAESYLERARPAAQDDESLLADVLAAEAYIARARGDDERTIDISQQALALLPETDHSARSVVGLNLGIALWKRSRLQEAAQALEVARQSGERSGNHYAGLMGLVFSAMLQAAWGELHQAGQLCQQAFELGRQLPALGLAHTIYAMLLYEWNDLEAAATHVETGIEMCQRSGNSEVQIGGYRVMARLRQALGDASGALTALEEAGRLARERDTPWDEQARNAACHVQICLAQDDLAAASRWAEQVTGDADASSFYPTLGVTPARLLLAQGRKKEAAEQLAARHEAAVQAGWRYGAMEVRALQALAAPTQSDALVFLADALALAEPEGCVRTFVDKGEPMAELLRAAVASGLCLDYGAGLLTLFADASEDKSVTSVRRPSSLVEPLSERELDLLPLLAAGQTYHEMALSLCVSTNTIKTHLKHIYGKLAVRNRREAVAKARELDLL